MLTYNYIKDFHKSRQARIGASDISCLIPHPIKQIESLSAYSDSKNVRHAMTALDLYNEKINGKDYEYSFPAEMGHYLEGRALFEFISDNISRDIATEFFRGYSLHKIEQENNKSAVNPEPYNNTPFKHNTEVTTEWGVSHADCVYDAGVTNISLPNGDTAQEIINIKRLLNIDSLIIRSNGLIIDLSKPFLIEAKSARYFSARRKEDPYTGYDLTLSNWQGVPLKVYFQVQFQMLLYNVDTCYITLIYDTSSKHYWQISANKKHQAELQQLAMYMKNCIDTRTPPKELLMNSKDIASLYPEIREDFRELKDDELTAVLKIVTDGINASEQEKAWKKKKEIAEDMLSIHLKDTQILKGNIGGMITDIAKWKDTGGGQRVMGLGDIEKRDDSKKILNYLKKNGLIKQGEEKRKASIVIKKKELDSIEIK